MSRIRRILIAVKELGGKPSPAILKGAQLARALGAQVDLFHALAEPLNDDPSFTSGKPLADLEGELRQNALRRLEAIAGRMRAHSIKVTVGADWDYPAHEAIIRRAMRVGADLVIAAGHPTRHVLPSILRLTDWELVRHCPVPLLLVKDRHAYRHPAVLAAIDPGHAHGKPPALDRQILRLGKVFSTALRGRLHAVHAYAPFPAVIPPEGISPHTLQAVRREADRAARKRLARVLRLHPVARVRQHLLPQSPIDAIAQSARESKSSIVVMGAISRSGYKRLLIGNTAERILDDLSCDILVVKQEGFQTRVPRASRGMQVWSISPFPVISF